MAIWDRIRGRQNDHAAPATVDLVEALTAARGDLELYSERLAELELQLAEEDLGWRQLGPTGDTEFTHAYLLRVIRQARIAYLKSPLINRAVALQADYVFGQGVTLKARDSAVDQIVQAWWQDRANRAELTSHQALLGKEVALQTDGNLLYVLFTERATGRVTIRSLPVAEVQEIVMNPQDRRDPWYYRRRWTEMVLDLTTGTGVPATKEAYYPDWQYQPAAAKPQTIAGKPVLWDQPIYHRKVGGLEGMRFGVPEVYAALDWARAYKEFLEDRATVSRALSRFAWRLATGGGKQGVAAAKQKLGTTLASGTSGETNPPPVAGSTWIAGDPAALEPMKMAGATIHPDEGRRFLLMAAAATGWAEQFFGDSQVGALATAKALDRPAELRIRARQQMWTEDFQDLAGYVIAARQAAPRGGLGGQVDVTVDVIFPPILEHDVAPVVGAAVDAITLRGQPRAGVLSADEERRVLVTALRPIAEIDETPVEPQTPEAPTQEAAAVLAEAERALKISKADIAKAKAWVASLGDPVLTKALD